jgi:hypothetical protein
MLFAPGSAFQAGAVKWMEHPRVHGGVHGGTHGLSLPVFDTTGGILDTPPIRKIFGWSGAPNTDFPDIP